MSHKKKEEQKIRPEIGSLAGTSKEAAGLQTFQIDNEVVSKEEFQERVKQFKRDIGDISGPVMPFETPTMREGRKPEEVQPTAGRTAEQFQAIQQREQQLAQQKPITAEELPPTGVVSEKLQKGVIDFPIIGRQKAAITSEVLFKKIEAGEELTAEDTAMISQLQLNDLDIAQIQAGKTHISRLEEFVDSVPIIGRRKRIVGVSIGVTDFVAETPSGRVNKLLDSMQASKTNVVNWAAAIKNNPASASTYLPLIEGQEQEILELQSRIKLMSIQQEKIQANPEIYDDIQKEINDILTKTGSAKTDLQLLGIR